MLADKVVCVKIGLDSYDDFFKQVLDLRVNINVNRQSSTAKCNQPGPYNLNQRYL